MKKAQKLELANTHFDNPHGLDGQGQYSSALDMAKLAAYFMEVPALRDIVGTDQITRAGRHMKNHNRLLRSLEGAEGLKTGYTSKAGRCLVSSVTRNEKRLIAVTLNAPDDWDDHEKLYTYGFEAYPARQLLSVGYRLDTVPVVSGDVCFVQVYAEKDIRLCLSDEELRRLECVVELPRFVYAPVHKDACAGRIVYLLDGCELAQSELRYADFANELSPAKAGLLRGLIDRLKNWLA